MDYILFMFFICLGAYVVLYVLGRYYLLEPFTSGETERARKMAAMHAAPSTYNTTGIREDLVGDLPYATNPIMRLDDYEYSMIFQSEGNRAAQSRSISDAMSRYPSDWCALPPSAALFQTSQEGFTNAVARDQAAAPADVSEFDSISGTAEQPPDMDAIEEEEKKLLAMYKPEDTKDLIHYSLKDAKGLVEKMYEKRGLVADVQKSKQGENVFEIVEVTPKNPVIVWEDDPSSPQDRETIRGENRINVPITVNDMSAGLDPFYEPNSSTRLGKNDYTKWTPGLERQFAPTYTGAGWA
jgi:hypothetical protein